jgi:hypothetical protein
MIQKYVDQLAEDIQKAAERITIYSQLKSLPDSIGEDFQDPIAGVEEFLHGPKYKLSEIVGIEASMLPADHLLSDGHTELLASKMESLLIAFHFYPDFPTNNGKTVPPRLRYRAMRESWEYENPIVSSGEIHIEFCDYDETQCPFPGYCTTCSEFPENEEEFIPSIYNYCDRWCERCAFTAKCRSFALEKELLELQNNTEKSLDEKIPGIENRLSGSFPDGIQEGSDTATLFDYGDQEIPNDLLSIKNKSKRHPIAVLTHTYSEKSHQWLKTVTKTCRIELTQWLASGDADQILNAIETVGWYHFFIYPKILRALSGYFELEDDDFAEEDMNGTAKIALISIDKSIEAFTFLMAHIPSQQIEIKGFIEQLGGLRKEMEVLFPYARRFIRRGLDE